MQVINFHSSTLQELEKKLSNSISENFKPSLAIVFSSVVHDTDQLVSLFREHGITLIGCTSSGEFADDEINKLCITTMLLDIDESCFRVILKKGANTRENAHLIAQKALSDFEKPALITFSSGLSVNGDNIISGTKEVADLPLYGALAGDDFNMQATYVYDSYEKSDNALVTLVIDTNKILVNGLATSGWKAVGTPKKATKSEGNVLYTINNEPALDVFLRYFNISVKDKKKEVITKVGVKYPLQVERGGYKTLRAPLMANDDGSIILAGAIHEGENIYFSMPPDFDIIDQTISDLSSLKAIVPEVDAVLLFSCQARNVAFGPLIGAELNGLHEIWKAPLIGFFSYGEIGTLYGTSTCDFHNETASLVLLKEK